MYYNKKIYNVWDSKEEVRDSDQNMYWKHIVSNKSRTYNVGTVWSKNMLEARKLVIFNFFNLALEKVIKEILKETIDFVISEHEIWVSTWGFADYLNILGNSN